MDVSAAHMGFVFASYGLTVLCLAALITATLTRDRRLRAEAQRLDEARRKPRA